MDKTAAIRDVVARYLAAYENHDGMACGAVYADDAVVLSPWGPPLFGPDAITAAHFTWFEEGETNKIMTIVDVVADGETGICLLHYESDIAAENGQSGKVFGTSLNTLKRQTDGTWKIRHTSLNELEDRPTGFEE